VGVVAAVAWVSPADALTAQDAINRAQDWVNNGNMLYCQAPNHAWDSVCNYTCTRPDNAAWDPYRSDCSGYVSWAWGLPSPGRVTWQLAPFQTDITSVINGSDLQPADALNNNHHIILFKGWVTPGSRASFYEEGDCGQVAHEFDSNVSINGSSVYVSWEGDTFTSIRYGGLQPPVRVSGWIDAASDTVVGWAADLDHGNDVLNIDVYFGGAPGTGYKVSDTAPLSRPDVAAALGIGPNHGYSVATPRYYCDTNTHPVHVIGHAVTDGTPVELSGSPKDFTCAPANSPPGILRHVTAPPVLTTWAFDLPKELAWMTPPDAASHKIGVDWPDARTLGTTADGAVWVVDGTQRRHVIDPASFAAWGFDASTLVAWTDADAANYTIGLDLPATPVLLQPLGDPAIYVLDVDPTAPPSSSSGTTTSTGVGGGAGSGGGNAVGGPTSGGGPLSKGTCSCSTVGTGTGAGSAWAFAIALGIAKRRRRRG
jgi:MYXO-CTERM domain-containing protein